MAVFPKLYHPDHPDNSNPDPKVRKTLTPTSNDEMGRLLGMGWVIMPEEFLKAAKS